MELASERIEGLSGRAIEVLTDCLDSDDDKVRLRAAETLLDRAGLGARQRVELTGDIKTSHQLDAQLELVIGEIMTKNGSATGVIIDATTLPGLPPIPPELLDGEDSDPVQ